MLSNYYFIIFLGTNIGKLIGDGLTCAYTGRVTVVISCYPQNSWWRHWQYLNLRKGNWIQVENN